MRIQSLLCVMCFGGFSNIFCDFSENFHVKDIDGEEAKTGVITEITNTDSNTSVTTAEPHNLASDDVVNICTT